MISLDILSFDMVSLDKIVQIPFHPFHRSIRSVSPHGHFKRKRKFSIWRFFFIFVLNFKLRCTLRAKCLRARYVRWYLLNSFYIESWIFQREHVANLYSESDVRMYEGFVGLWEFIRKYHGKTRADRFKNCTHLRPLSICIEIALWPARRKREKYFDELTGLPVFAKGIHSQRGRRLFEILSKLNIRSFS